MNVCDMRKWESDSLSLWFNRFDLDTLEQSVSLSICVLFAQLLLVDNLIKLFIVDIYHVIKHATLCVYNKTHAWWKKEITTEKKYEHSYVMALLL